MIRLTGALATSIASYPVPPAAVTLDIDDTVEVVHGAQQLYFLERPLWRALLPADPCLRHRYRVPVAMLLRTGKTPSGKEVATSHAEGSAERIYDTLYCARSHAKNLIKLHKRS